MSARGRCCGAIALILAVASTTTIRAQQSDSMSARSVPRAVKAGKWVLLGTTIGMGLLAVSSHHQGDQAYSDLEAYCASDRSRCDLDNGGSYIDPKAESLYQESLSYDRKARGWFIGGEVALVGTAVLFIWEFTRPHERPENIPFEPEFRVGPSGTRLGVRMAF